MSKFSGISKYYLSREFKKYTGFSPNDYLIQLRVDHAKYLLLSTTLPANKISHIVGIHDMNNFNNLFKRKTGITPGKYRSSYATNDL
jgi:AraC-like DNA-binding protein